MSESLHELGINADLVVDSAHMTATLTLKNKDGEIVSKTVSAPEIQELSLWMITQLPNPQQYPQYEILSRRATLLAKGIKTYFALNFYLQCQYLIATDMETGQEISTKMIAVTEQHRIVPWLDELLKRK